MNCYEKEFQKFSIKKSNPQSYVKSRSKMMQFGNKVWGQENANIYIHIN